MPAPKRARARLRCTPSLRTLRRALPALLAGVLGVLASAPPAAGQEGNGRVEVVDLVPEESASFRLSRVFAWLRPGHNFEERTLTVETTPPGANLDLFYIRANFQKRYQQSVAPARVLLPRRFEAGPRDAVTVRAFLEGYRQREVTVRVSSPQDRIHLDLDPLPNELVRVGHTYFAGRTELAFLTREVLTVRVQERDGGFNVILAETARNAEARESLDGIRSPWIESVETLQLGEDLLVRVATTEPLTSAGLQLRSRQSRDDLRDLYVYSVDMVPGDGGADAVRRARAALARLGPAHVGACPLAFDEELRDALDGAALSRALAPRGAFTDPYLRAAMKRLGEISPGGRIAMLDGSRFDPASPIELAAALSQAAEASGYLALLRSFVGEMESGAHRRRALHSLLAPEVSPSRFQSALERAAGAEQRCRGGS